MFNPSQGTGHNIGVLRLNEIRLLLDSTTHSTCFEEWEARMVGELDSWCRWFSQVFRTNPLKLLIHQHCISTSPQFPMNLKIFAIQDSSVFLILAVPVKGALNVILEFDSYLVWQLGLFFFSFLSFLIYSWFYRRSFRFLHVRCSSGAGCSVDEGNVPTYCYHCSRQEASPLWSISLHKFCSMQCHGGFWRLTTYLNHSLNFFRVSPEPGHVDVSFSVWRKLLSFNTGLDFFAMLIDCKHCRRLLGCQLSSITNPYCGLHYWLWFIILPKTSS